MPLEINRKKSTQPKAVVQKLNGKSSASFFKKKLSDKFKENFFKQLYVLISSGMDLKSSLNLLVSETKDSFEKKILSNLLGTLISGSAFSASLKQSGYFSDYEYYSIKIGEETGRLSHILNDLHLYFKRRIQQNRQIVSALTYPAIVMSVAGMAVFFLLFFMVPMFADVFKKFNRDLPWITNFILKLSYFIKDYSLYMIAICSALVYVLYQQKEKIWFRKMFSSIVLKIPVLGDVISKLYLSRFCNSMSLMISSKISLVKALELSSHIIKFYPIEITLSDIEQNITKGISLNESMSAYTIYPSKMILMIKVGEQVNKLEVFFEQVGLQYQEECDHQVGMLSSLLEPLLIVFLGLIVGIVLVAMYLPMFELSSVF